MDKLKARTGNILDELEKASLKLNLEDKKQQLNNLESEVSNPEIWLNPSVAQEKTCQSKEGNSSLGCFENAGRGYF